MLFVLIAVSLLTFVLARGALPPETALAPFVTPRMDDSAKLSLARSLGVATMSCPSFAALLDHQAGCIVPLWGQYYAWLNAVLDGNWGYSLLPGISGGSTLTWDVFFARFPDTAVLAVAGTFLTIIIAVPIGIVSATHNNKLPDHLSRMLALLGYSMPIFWLAYLLQVVFGIYAKVPSGGYQLALLPTNGDFSSMCGLCVSKPGSIAVYTHSPLVDSIVSGNPQYFWDSLVALVLPAVTLSVSTVAILTRVIRSSMLEVLRQDYILLARSKGLAERIVIYRHALKNALLPASTLMGLIFAYLLGGVIVVETIFSWPGVGAAAYMASVVLDINFLELYILVTAVIIVVANLTADIAYAMLDPRIRY